MRRKGEEGAGPFWAQRDAVSGGHASSFVPTWHPGPHRPASQAHTLPAGTLPKVESPVGVAFPVCGAVGSCASGPPPGPSGERRFCCCFCCLSVEFGPGPPKSIGSVTWWRRETRHRRTPYPTLQQERPGGATFSLKTTCILFFASRADSESTILTRGEAPSSFGQHVCSVGLPLGATAKAEHGLGPTHLLGHHSWAQGGRFPPACSLTPLKLSAPVPHSELAAGCRGV